MVSDVALMEEDKELKKKIRKELCGAIEGYSTFFPAKKEISSLVFWF
jgi:hypothetical protein